MDFRDKLKLASDNDPIIQLALNKVGLNDTAINDYNIPVLPQRPPIPPKPQFPQRPPLPQQPQFPQRPQFPPLPQPQRPQRPQIPPLPQQDQKRPKHFNSISTNNSFDPNSLS